MFKDPKNLGALVLCECFGRCFSAELPLWGDSGLAGLVRLSPDGRAVGWVCGE